MGWRAQQRRCASRPVVIGYARCVWRCADFPRAMRTAQLSKAQLQVACSCELEGNAALAGVMWAVGDARHLPRARRDRARPPIVVHGPADRSRSAAFFMTLVGRSFEILAGIQLGALIVREPVQCELGAVAAARGAGRSLFGVTMYRAAREFKATPRRARSATAWRPRRPTRCCSERRSRRRGRRTGEVAVPRDDESRNPHADERRAGRARSAAPLAARRRTSAGWCAPRHRPARR